MRLWVYEVEMEPHAKGQTFQQHIIAASPKQARELVSHHQKRPVVRVTARRRCTDAEIERWRAEKAKSKA